jgi:hypothetical protein
VLAVETFISISGGMAGGRQIDPGRDNLTKQWVNAARGWNVKAEPTKRSVA